MADESGNRIRASAARTRHAAARREWESYARPDPAGARFLRASLTAWHARNAPQARPVSLPSGLRHPSPSKVSPPAATLPAREAAGSFRKPALRKALEQVEAIVAPRKPPR
jgi:hypothetical protein